MKTRQKISVFFKRIGLWCSLFFGVYILSPWGLAEGDMTFKGTLITPPPCKINETVPLDVYFGNRLGVKKIDGVRYAKPLTYVLDCQDPGEYNWVLRLTFKGTSAPFDARVFKTTSLSSNKANEQNLGVKIYQVGGGVLSPNDQIDIRDSKHPPQLIAVPVARPGSVLIEGEFETLVTLQAHYE